MSGENKQIGKYLSQLRKSRGLSARQLAKRSGVSQAYISQIERGVYNNPQPDILEKLAKALNVSQMELLLQAGIVKDNVELETAIESNIKKLVKRKNKALKTEKKLKGIRESIEEIKYIIEDTSTYREKKDLLEHIDDLSIRFEIDKRRTIQLMQEIEILQTELNRHILLFQQLKDERRDIDLNEVLENSRNITFNGKTLTDDERKDVIQMLNIFLNKNKK